MRCDANNGGLDLPDGFCASIFAEGAGRARHITVTPMGRVFVAVANSQGASDAHVLALYDADNDGVAEQKQTFGTGGNGIFWANGRLYVAPNDRVVRYAVADGQLTPSDPNPVTVVSGLTTAGDHTAKTVVVEGAAMYVNIGSASNTCQEANRQLESPGIDPCPELTERAAVWQFDPAGVDRPPSSGTLIGKGVRNGNALAIEPTSKTLWAAINGRDQLFENWPQLFTAEQDKDLPGEELVAIKAGVDRGWPYCYHDPVADQMKLAPEYDGDGEEQGRCAAIPPPPVAFAGHAAPLGMVFVTGTQFPSEYRGGALVANHGSRFDANAPGDPNGYDVQFVPFANGQPSGEPRDFATGFDAGMRPLPEAAPYRPVGLAMMPDGSLLIGDDKGGRIWRVFYRP